MSNELPEEDYARIAHVVGSSGDGSDAPPPPPPGAPTNLSTEAVLGSDRTPVLSSPSPSEPPPPTVNVNSSTASVSDPTTDFRQLEEISERTVTSTTQVHSGQLVSDPNTAESVTASSSKVSNSTFSGPSIPEFNQTTHLPTNPSSHSLSSSPTDPVHTEEAVASVSSTHPADPETKEEDFVDPNIVAEILDLGFDEPVIVLALKHTKGIGGAEAAINWILERSNESDFESDNDGENGMGGVQSTFASLRPHKMVFVVNLSLKMGVGKLAAQVGHATLGVYRLAQRSDEGQRALELWRAVGEMKVVVKGQNTEQLLELFKQAKDAGLFAYLVSDAGRTQIPAGSRTVLGIFGPSEVVDQVTGHLKLL